MKKYWLIKSEENVYSIDDLKKDKVTAWTGVRNYQARNMMRDEMRKGDMCLYYHSNSKPTGIVGVCTVAEERCIDETQFDKNSEYVDIKSKIENPTWICVKVKFVSKFKKVISLEQIKQDINLQNMEVIKKGNRLSVQRVSERDFGYILNLNN
jgi:predicted RNA-binding protein with PUA-like domain